ncbi:hypothetical protein OA240_01440 [bacterium]|nr:hypothetical protein [bacterium]
MAGVAGCEPPVHGIKTRGNCYQELSVSSQPFKIVLILLMLLMSYQENHENCCQKCCQQLAFW